MHPAQPLRRPTVLRKWSFQLAVARCVLATVAIAPLLDTQSKAAAQSPTKELDNVPSVLENGAVVRRNGVYYNNRPLYGSPGYPGVPYYYVFGGDRPLVRFGGSPWMDGCFVLGFQKQGGQSKWLLDFTSVEFRYYGGRIEWVASDPAFPGVTISLHALPLGTGLGLAAQAKVTGATAGDRLLWMLGGAYRHEHVAAIDTLVTREPR